MNKLIEIKDFSTICRICLFINDKMLSITTLEIINMLEACASIEVLKGNNYQKSIEEKLPQQICDKCYLQLKNAYEFQAQCRNSIKTLYNILLKHNPHTPMSSNEEFNGTSVQILENVCNSLTSLENFDNIPNSPQSTLEFYDDDENSKSSSNSIKLENGEFHEEEEIKENETNPSRQKSVADLLIKKYNIYGLTCNICQKDLSNRFSMLRHMEVHDQNRSLKYHCKTCNKGFYAAENLKKHEIRHLGKTKYQCDKCPKRFYVLSALGVHCKSSHKAKPITCTQCSQQFYHQLQIEQHMQTHEEKKFVCEDCGKIFPTRNRLTKHKKIHSDERPYKCPICTRGFKQKFDLTNHVKYRHEESDRREICNICGKLLHPGSLRAHLETHNTDTIYKCEQCGKIYANRIILGKHINQKHKMIDLMKKYLCKVCNKALESDENLKRHMLVVHARYKRKECHICGKTYKSKKGLNVHIQSAHMDVRPHLCQTCNKAFHTKARLQNHMRSHTGERPFSCSICGKAFGFKQVLKTHMNIHSK
ncbi:zinc finger protein OZF-like [Chrysoperla carnea]|uniref:zinc finger protein OZF-like n=1 Tax=Chrysoperla carnea TaxID=189513 RepID=UPI001D073FBC|nr:zinc finger protein OZF-like [Chrysoperla carnea]